MTDLGQNKAKTLQETQLGQNRDPVESYLQWTPPPLFCGPYWPTDSYHDVVLSGPVPPGSADISTILDQILKIGDQSLDDAQV